MGLSYFGHDSLLESFFFKVCFSVAKLYPLDYQSFFPKFCSVSLFDLLNSIFLKCKKTNALLSHTFSSLDAMSLFSSRISFQQQLNYFYNTLLVSLAKIPLPIFDIRLDIIYHLEISLPNYL